VLWMIESERNQNVIAATVLILGIISTGIIFVNVDYYSGSYALAGYVQVELEDIRVTNLDPDNETLIPGLFLKLNLKTGEQADGDVTLNTLVAFIRLNRQLIQYAAFRMNIPIDLRVLYPGYDQNFTLSSSLTDDHDQELLLDAYNNVNWTWSITIRYWYSVFVPENDAFREIAFSYNGVTGVGL